MLLALLVFAAVFTTAMTKNEVAPLDPRAAFEQQYRDREDSRHRGSGSGSGSGRPFGSDLGYYDRYGKASTSDRKELAAAFSALEKNPSREQ